ncbi:MAG: alpha/beta hydrolase [Candidatus Hodarchaeales archaeon]|jgi:enterochelin esterase family protein
MRTSTSFFILFLALSFFSPSTALPSFTFIDFYNFLDQYEAATTGDKSTIITDYLSWQNSSGGGFPVIVNNSHVVFIYFNATETINSCLVKLDVFDWINYTMIQLDPNIPFFYHAFTLHPATRLGYVFFVNGNATVDPRNPHQAKSSWDLYNSELAMPLFVRETHHIFRPEIPHGTITPLTNYSTDPYVQIYLPPNYNSSSTYPVVYFPDGSVYVDLLDTPIILDNLIAENLIIPLIAVFADPPGFDPTDPFSYDWDNRGAYYLDKISYFNDLDSLVAYIDDQYPTITFPAGRLHVGLSLTGHLSAVVGLERPNTFRNIAIQSMVFFPSDIPTIYQNVDPSIDLNFWISCGTYELYGKNKIYNRSEGTKEIAQFFIDKSWEVSLHFYPEGHKFAFWAHTMDELFIYFFPPSYTTPTTTTPATTTPTTTPASTSSFFFLPVLLVLFVVSNYRRKQ